MSWLQSQSRDHSHFPVSQYVCEQVNYLDSRRFAAMHESEVGLTIDDPNIIIRVKSVRTLGNLWLPCWGQKMFVSRFANSKENMLVIRCYEDVEYEHAPWDIIDCARNLMFWKVPLSLVVFRRPSHLFCLIEWPDYWWCDCTFECRLHMRQPLILVDWHKLETFATPPASRYEQYIMTLPLWRAPSIIVCSSWQPPLFYIFIPMTSSGTMLGRSLSGVSQR